MLGRVVNLQPLDQTAGFLGRERRLQRGRVVPVELVEDQDDPLDVRIVHGEQLPDAVGEVQPGPLLADRDVAPAPQRFGDAVR